MKLMVYPASKEVSAFARHNDMLCNVESLSLVIPKGRGVSGADFNVVDLGEPCNTAISNNFEETFASADTLYLPESTYKLPQSFIKSKIDDATRANKKIYISGNDYYSSRVNEEYQLPSDFWELPFDLNTADVPRVCTIPVPVIFVMGLGPQTNKFEVQLSLRRAFLNSGYRLAQIASKKMGWFFGFNSLPNEFWTKCHSSYEKIVYLNRFIYNKYLIEKPEVMIIGVPGSIMPLNHLKYEEVCDMAFLMSQAVSPDLTVLCIYVHDYSTDYFDMLYNMCKYRYNANVTHLVVAGNEAYLSPDSHRSEFVSAPESLVREKIADFKSDKFKLYYALSGHDMSLLGSDAIETLVQNM